MLIIHAILLGAIQGLTEFLPVSSSGHLVLLQRLLDFKGPDVVFDTFLHVGTLVAVCVAFRRDLKCIGQTLIHLDVKSQHGRLFILLILGTIPTAFMGVAFRGFFERLFSQVFPAALMLLVTGCILFVADRVKNHRTIPKGIKKIDAILVGIVQGLSIVPGLSRSGSTISAGIFLGLDRNVAARFSFLLSIPAIAGAGVLQAPNVTQLEQNLVLPLIIGTVVSAVTGYVAIKILLRMVSQKRLSFFSYYCWTVGLGVLLVSVFHILG